MGVQQNSLQFTNYLIQHSLISLNYSSMAGDLKSCRYRAAVEQSSDDGYRDENHLEYGCYKKAFYKRSFDHHDPVCVTSNGINPSKRPCPSSYSATRCNKQFTKSKPRISCSSSRGARLRMEELQCIKRELKVIKNQIDDLLNSLEHMGTRNRRSAALSVVWKVLLAVPSDPPECSERGRVLIPKKLEMRDR
ncbi:RNA-binding Raly-like protein [Salminus brasiliensis]|uniref:RNA-binding Raly-like protein n=1 Tax=Salminus brasiliensis TaxID=930266 RepID=UPI003B835112